MVTESLETHYARLPLETVARHEAGHAVMAHVCGGSVKCIVLGRTAFGENFGRAFWTVPSIDEYLLVLSGGALALYLHECHTRASFQGFCDWVYTPGGGVMAASGATDWMEILRLTEQPKGDGIDDFLQRAVHPYFDQAIDLLARAQHQLDTLSELLVIQSPGIGRRSLKRFFADRPRNGFVEWLDRPSVLLTANAEIRQLSASDR